MRAPSKRILGGARCKQDGHDRKDSTYGQAGNSGSLRSKAASARKVKLGLGWMDGIG